MAKKKPIEFEIDSNGCFNCVSHYINSSGHALAMINRKKMLIHRLVYQEMFGEIPDGIVVRHKCDNSRCINPEHLELGTQFENIQDRVKRGRSARGEKITIAALNDEKVKTIKTLLNSHNNSQIARMYDVCPNTIRDIRIGKTWKHVK